MDLSLVYQRSSVFRPSWDALSSRRLRETPTSEPVRRAGVLTGMTATFLHADKPVSPDEEIDGRTPNCEACGATMWLTNRTRRSTDDGTRDIRSYTCKNCGAAKDVVERI